MKPTNDDRQLLQFLKQYQPLPPPPVPDAEAQLMAIITKDPAPKPRSPTQIVWIFPVAIAAGIVVLWGKNTPLQPTPEVATDDNSVLVSNNAELTTIEDFDDQALEAFLQDCWFASLGKEAFEGTDPYGYSQVLTSTAY